MEAQCANHPNQQAITECAMCGKPICNICMVRSEGAFYCSKDCSKGRKAEDKHAVLYEVITADTSEEAASTRRRRHDAYR